jgi:hypothetical protein
LNGNPKSNSQDIVSAKLGDILVHIPSTTMVTANHERIHAIEFILKRFFENFFKCENPARCVVVLSKCDKKEELCFIESAINMGAIKFLEISKTLSSISIWKYHNGKQWGPRVSSSTKQGAEHFTPFAYDKFEKIFMNWASRNGIRDYKLTPILSSKMFGRLNIQSSSDELFPIATHNRNSPTSQHLLQFTSNDKSNWIETMNRATQDKSILFAGFFPKIFHSMLKRTRPDSYKEDIHLLRFELLEANCRIFEWYTKMNNWHYKILGKTMKNIPKLMSKTNDPIVNTSCGKKRKIENVHCTYQDRKKKHKY